MCIKHKHKADAGRADRARRNGVEKEARPRLSLSLCALSVYASGACMHYSRRLPTSLPFNRQQCQNYCAKPLVLPLLIGTEHRAADAPHFYEPCVFRSLVCAPVGQLRRRHSNQHLSCPFDRHVLHARARLHMCFFSSFFFV